MRIVELDREEAGDIADRGAAEHEQTQAVLQRARDEEVLLLEAELLAGGRRVVRVEDLRQVFAADLGVDRAPVLADLKCVEVEVLGSERGPQPEEVRRRRAVARNGNVE